MPYKNKEITPASYTQQHTAKKSHFYKGFSTLDPLNYGSKLYDFELIKQDILNHFNTRKGSRVMQPEFGSIIWELLMEPLTEQVKELLTNDINFICNFDPRAYPTNIVINQYERGFIIDITLNLKNTDESQNMRLIFDQNLGLVAQ